MFEGGIHRSEQRKRRPRKPPASPPPRSEAAASSGYQTHRSPARSAPAPVPARNAVAHRTEGVRRGETVPLFLGRTHTQLRAWPLIDNTSLESELDDRTMRLQAINQMLQDMRNNHEVIPQTQDGAIDSATPDRQFSPGMRYGLQDYGQGEYAPHDPEILPLPEMSLRRRRRSY